MADICILSRARSEGYNLLISANSCKNSKHILASMIYFDSDMSMSTNTVIYFDWKTVIYIYVCRKCRTQLMLPMEKSVTFTGACANEIIPSINRSFVYKAKEGRHLRIKIRCLLYLFFCDTLTSCDIPYRIMSCNLSFIFDQPII